MPNPSIHQVFLDEFLRLPLRSTPSFPLPVHDYRYTPQTPGTACNAFCEAACRVLDHLRQWPYSSASQVALQTATPREHLRIIYKLIQRSAPLQDYLADSCNQDYFRVVRHHFDERIFVMVFFVGLTCPSRCFFCPNVTVTKNERRILRRYPANRDELLSSEDIQRVFVELNELEQRGEQVLVKVSGGLEPLTDMKTFSCILDCAADYDIPVRLLTNGMLLDTEDRRRTALRTRDIRISLNVTDAELYSEICFGSRDPGRRKFTLSRLQDNLRHLVAERDARGQSCHIGLNSIIIPANRREIGNIITFAARLNLDYVDFKPDYFSPQDASIQADVRHEVDRSRQLLQESSARNPFVNFSSTLSPQSFFWTPRDGFCDPLKQSRYKLFVTPYGHCTPVHHGAFPKAKTGGTSISPDYSLGKLSPATGLLDLLFDPHPLPPIEYHKLNPFELILTLEIERQEQDRQWGIPAECNPYLTRWKDLVPDGLLDGLGQELHRYFARITGTPLPER